MACYALRECSKILFRPAVQVDGAPEQHRMERLLRLAQDEPCLCTRYYEPSPCRGRAHNSVDSLVTV